MKIEHWQSQSQYPDKQLTYGNLLGACSGNEGQPPKSQHCDTRKGETNLSRNPADPRHWVANDIHYLTDGRVICGDVAFDGEINDVLNLNGYWLKTNRKNVLDAFIDLRKKRPTVTLDKWFRHWNGESNSNDLSPFNAVVLYFIAKESAHAQRAH